MDEQQAPPQPPQPPSPQRRLQELRQIPERDRTDAEWDEMNELEIMLASQNRAGAPDPNIRRDNGQQRHPHQQRQNGGKQQGRPQGHQQNRNRPNRGGGPRR